MKTFGRSVRRGVVASAFLLGCRPAPRAPLPHGGAIAHLAAESGAFGGAVYSSDPSDPFNDVHSALFAARLEMRVPACAVAPAGCVSLSDAGYAAPFVGTDVAEGGDSPVTLFRAGIGPLLDPSRTAHATQALARARAIDPATRPVAAALLQHDLWERFDRIGDRAPELRSDLAATIWALALSAAALRAFPDNRAAIGRSDERFFSGFAEGRGWFEIATCTDAGAKALDTEHARGAGYRSAVRVLVAPAEGEDPSDLASEVASGQRMEELRPGTRLVLVEYPMAVSRDDGPIALPIATLVQTRTVLAADAGPKRLDELAFDVWEAHRRRLVQGSASAPFEHLRDDRWLPEGVTMTPSILDRAFPLRAACVTCHEPRGARLFASTTGAVCAVPLDESRQAAWSVAKKTAAEDFAALSAMKPPAPVGVAGAAR